MAGMESIKRVPYIPLRGQAFFPGTIVGFDIGRDKSLAAVDLAMNGDKYIVVSSQRDPSVSAPKMDDCYMTGVIIRVRQVVKKNEDYARILVVVEQRVRIEDIYEAGDMLYHLLVLLTAKGLRIEDIALELQRRHDPQWDAQRRQAKAAGGK